MDRRSSKSTTQRRFWAPSGRRLPERVLRLEEERPSKSGLMNKHIVKHIVATGILHLYSVNLQPCALNRAIPNHPKCFIWRPVHYRYPSNLRTHTQTHRETYLSHLLSASYWKLLPTLPLLEGRRNLRFLTSSSMGGITCPGRPDAFRTAFVLAHLEKCLPVVMRVQGSGLRHLPVHFWC